MTGDFKAGRFDIAADSVSVAAERAVGLDPGLAMYHLVL